MQRAKNQLLLSHLYRYFTVNKNLPDPSDHLSKIVPSSSIEAANARVSVLLSEPQNPEEKVVGRGPYQICMVVYYSGRPNALVDMAIAILHE